MGNFYFWGFWLVAGWGAWDMRGVVGKLGSEHERSRLPQGWNIVSEDLLLPASIVGSFTKVPRGWTPVCLVTEQPPSPLPSWICQQQCLYAENFLTGFRQHTHTQTHTLSHISPGGTN